MAITVSVRDLTPQDISDQRTATIRDLQAMLKPVAGNQPIVVRDARPTDFNNGTLVGYLDTTSLTTDVYSTDIYTSWTNLKSPTQLLAILGFASFSALPTLDELTFIASGQTLGINVIDQCYSNTVDTRVFFFPPYVWTFNEHVRVDFLSHATGVDDQQSYQWIALIAETQSVVVPPRALAPGGRIPGMI